MYKPEEHVVTQLGRGDIQNMTPEQVEQATRDGQFADLLRGRDPNANNVCPHCGGSLDTPPPSAA